MSETESNKTLSFTEGLERKREREELISRLQDRIREIIEYRQKLGERYEHTTDPMEQIRVLESLEKLDAKINKGADLQELIKEKNPQDIENYITEDYQNLK